jgi:RNA polymerase sigma-70 factor (ECF subfamily)
MTDTHHFEAFMHAYENMVYSTAVRLLGSETDAQDIAQEVFLKAFERFHDLGQSPTAGGWLKTVTTNLCLNHLSRYRARWRFFSEMLSKNEDKNFVDELAAPETLEKNLETADQRRLLEQALHKLPAAQRVALVLYHFEDLGYDEVAAKLGVSLSKVKTDIHRGRLSLQRYLKPDLLRGEECVRDRAAASPAALASRAREQI